MKRYLNIKVSELPANFKAKARRIYLFNPSLKETWIKKIMPTSIKEIITVFNNNLLNPAFSKEHKASYLPFIEYLTYLCSFYTNEDHLIKQILDMFEDTHYIQIKKGRSELYNKLCVKAFEFSETSIGYNSSKDEEGDIVISRDTLDYITAEFLNEQGLYYSDSHSGFIAK